MKVQERDRLLFRAIAENDLDTVKRIVPSKVDPSSILFFPVVGKLQRWEIARYLLDKLQLQDVQDENVFQLAIQCCHPRFVNAWIECVREDESWYELFPEIPIWLHQLQLTRGIIYENQRPSTDEKEWWWQATIGLPIDYIEDVLEEDWSDKIFPFLLKNRMGRLYDLHRKGGLFRMLLLAGVIPWNDDLYQHVDSLHPLTLDLVLGKAKLPSTKLLLMVRNHLNSEKPSIDSVRVFLKYIPREEIPMSVLLTLVDLGPEMMALFF
jgi:hypothetical protein